MAPSTGGRVAAGAGAGAAGADSDGGSPMAGKYCIVTGSNGGIGYQVARGLMQRGAHVVMGCRNMEACEQAAARLREEALAGSCACRKIDLEDQASIRAFAAQQATELSAAASGSGRSSGDGVGSGGGKRVERRLDVLVNNAGVMGVSAAADGMDRHLTANHVGPYLLTRLLLPHMTRGSRVINVASRAHYAGRLALVTGPPGREAFVDNAKHWWWRYARSKLCNVLFTAELQRRHGAGGIGAHSVSPGLVDSGIFRYLLPEWAQWLKLPLRPLGLFRTPEQGAEVVVYAASSPDLQGSTALFLHDCREMKPSAAASDARLASDLWRVSAALVGLPPDHD